jgi:SSS family solute:Na+ symporter
MMNLYLLFFIIYFTIVIIIGIVSSKKSTEDDFMIANRKVAVIQVAATMSAGFFDGAALSLYLAYLYQYGFSAIWLFVGIALGFILVRKYAWKIKQKADKMKAYSMPEYFYKLFGKKNGIMFSTLLVLQFFGYLIVNFIISGKVLTVIFSIPYPISVMIGGAIILTYLLLAGFKAVIRTDFFQVIIMIVMSLTAGVFLFGRTHIPASEFNLATLGFGNIVGFLLIAGLGIMVAPDLWQRIFATKDEKNLRRGLGYSSMILIVLACVISIVGLATKQFLPNILPQDALVAGFSQLLPFGLKEFGMVLLYAVALSSSDTVTFVVASIFTRDFKNYSKRFSDESMKRLTRFFMVLFVVLAATTAIFYQNILHLGLSLASLNLMLFPVVFGSLYWKLNKNAVFWSLFLGLVSVLILFVSSTLTPETAIISLPVTLLSLLILQKVLKKRNT